MAHQYQTKMKYLSVLMLLLIFVQCTPKNNYEESYNSISEEGLANHIAVLASDEFLGRKPFTEGETKTINYIKSEFEKLGLKPGLGNSYFQEVAMVELTSQVENDEMKITGGSNDLTLTNIQDFVAFTSRIVEDVEVKESEMIFAGFGIVAPEYNWNDYAGLDVKGKTVVVLINDPGFGSDDKSFFKGNEMTYYGRWTYKYEEAARQGAEAVIIIHQTAHASYPFEVVQGSWGGANLKLESADGNTDKCAVESWISEDAAKKLFANAGVDNYNYYAEAKKRDFKAFSLKQNMSVTLKNKIKKSKSNNVMAIYEGETEPDEVIIYSAHWDHLGVGTPVEGDSIFNGAIDNGTGVAAILEVARAFQQLNLKTKRSVAFLLVTAEEQGLLGSEYYAANPVFAPEKTVANINVDAIKAIGRVNDFSIVGYGQSELEDYAKRAAEKQGRYITPDPHPEAGSFFRSDHFNFAKIGIPALYGKGAIDSDKNGKEWGDKMSAEYTSKQYHKVTDEYSPDLDFEGVKLDTQIYFEVGFTLANETVFPKWKEGSEFKARREQ